jgi:K+-transporting ATPase ATPase C chain
MKEFWASLKMILVMTVLLGGVYPLAVTAIGQALFHHAASGSLVNVDGKVRGSELLAQKFTEPKYFWPRPSAIDFNPLPSGGSNLSPASGALKAQVEERRQKLTAAHPEVPGGVIPQELLFTSASGLDPDLSLAGASYQAARVAGARGMTLQQVTSVIDRQAETRQFRILGEPRVNVLMLNLALDSLAKASTQ